MKIIIAGQAAFGAAVFEAVTEAGHEVVQVFAPIERHGQVDPLAQCALHADLPVNGRAITADQVTEDADILVAAFCTRYIHRDAYGKLQHGGIAYHPSLLPRHRGRDAIRWTIHMRDAVAGGTVYRLTDEVDGGPILAQQHCLVRPDDTASTLYRRELFPLGVRLILVTLTDLDLGIHNYTAQDETCATWEPAFTAGALSRGR